MRLFTARVTEVSTFGRQRLVRCAAAGYGAPAPGQVCHARAEAAAQPFLRFPLHLRPDPPGGFDFLLDPEHPLAAVEPGAALDLLGPGGRGFNLPPKAAHLLLAAASLQRLHPLLQHALARRLALTLLWPDDEPLPPLPPAVEIQRGGLNAELARWADVVAADVPDPEAWARAAHDLRPGQARGFVQAVLEPLMPCGVGACQACWVELDHGRALACVQGPVFYL
jgi:dihydroorotate dehydrogenase electron transfer subunit